VATGDLAMTMSEGEVEEAARVAVTAWVNQMSARGFKTVSDVNQREDGWAMEQSLAVFLDTAAADLRTEQAASLYQAGLRDAELNRVLTESLQRINVQVLKKLLELGFHVEKLLELCETGQSLGQYFSQGRSH
jgi:hypothetical protein